MVRIIDTDTHAVEAADLWTERMSSKWGDDRPHVRFVPEEQSDVWFVRDTPVMHAGFSVIGRDKSGGACRDEESFPNFITRFDKMHPSAWDPTERAKVMDSYGVEMAVLFPNLGFVGPDIYRVIPGSSLEFQLLIARAYNDWILGWATEQPGRFLPMACIPYWDVPSAVREVERCAELGHNGFVMTGVPELHGQPLLPDRHWDPLWSAVQATGRPVCFHAGGSTFVGSKDPLAERVALVGRAATSSFMTTRELARNGIVAADLIMSGILARFPTLQFVIVESGIGWVPFILEALDYHARHYHVEREIPEFTELPSFYFRRQMFANCWFEPLSKEQVERIGPSSILFETDFPHPTCLIDGEVRDAADMVVGDLDDATRDQILYSNAHNLFVGAN